jgi:hypothetical protein
MASNFKFKLLTSADPQAQYDAIATKDAMTFYLLNTGIGYLGTVKLFDATQSGGGGAITNLVTDMLAEGFTPDDTSAASTKAIVDYVAEQVSNVSTVLTTSFFRKVESHTLTADDLTNDAISKPTDVAEGDVGLLFTADTDNEAGGESYYFIPLTDYLQNVYDFESTNSIEMVAGENNKITANLKIKAGEESIKVDEENGGVYIEKATTVDEETPSAAKLVTEDALVAFVNSAIQKALTDVVTAAIDDGSES